MSVLVARAALGSEAESTLWSRSRDPSLVERARVERAVERLLGRAEEAGGAGAPLSAGFLRAALAILELVGRDATDHPRLALLLASLLGEDGIERWRQVRYLAEGAAPRLPDALRGRALLLLGTACAKLADRRCEIHAETEALELVWDREQRGTLLLNRAEALMLQGDLVAAVRDYRRALMTGRSPVTHALARYGLGVALERSGDLPQALAEIRMAASATFGPFGRALDLPGVFFVPAYERQYYLGLEALALGRAEADPAVARGHLAAAVEAFRAYAAAAEADGAPWASRARRHVARLESELAPRGPRRAGRRR